MHPLRTTIFTLIFIAALAGALFLLYQQQNATTPSNPISITQQVKGTEKQEITSPGTYTAEEQASHLELTRENIVWFTNYERAKMKIKPLVSVKALNGSSRSKNDDMKTFNYFDHVRTLANETTIGFDYFIDAQHYSFIKIGENLAMGDFSTSAEVVAAWMKSPAHKKNILDPAYREIGVSVQEGLINGKYVTLIVQHFGDPRNSCPVVSDSTKEAIGGLKLIIGKLQSTINDEQKIIAQYPNTHSNEFEHLITSYNELVEHYNTSIKQMEELVKKYNGQVRSFDLCVQGKR